MKHLIEWIKNKGLTQEQAALLIGISPAHLSLLLTNKRTPSVKVAVAISKLIKKSLDEILRAS